MRGLFKKTLIFVFVIISFVFFLKITTTSPTNTNKSLTDSNSTPQKNEASIKPTQEVLNAKAVNFTFATVVKVVDGDTIDVDLGNGNVKRVRYIGMDTPEVVDPRKPVQCFGKESTDENKKLVGGKVVGLEKDVSETDRYGRLLRYVYVGDKMINKILVDEGYARSATFPPDVKYQDIFRTAEQNAREANLGLWGSCNQETSR